MDQLTDDLLSLRIPRQYGEGPSVRPYIRVSLTVFGMLTVAIAAAFVVHAQWSRWSHPTERVALATINGSESAMAKTDLVATGYVVPQVVARIGPQTPGRIVKVLVKEGAIVHAQQILFELDDREQRTSATAAQLRAGVAEAGRMEQEAELESLKSQYARESKLLDLGAIAPAGLDDMRARIRVSEAVISKHREQVRAAQAEAAVHMVALQHAKIRAPFEGLVSTKPAALGDVVGPDSTLVEVVDLGSLKIETDVPEASLARLHEGHLCQATLDAIAGRTFRCILSEVGPKIDKAKATALVKVSLIEGTSELKLNMSGRVQFTTEPPDGESTQSPKRSLPSTAVVERGGRKTVFTWREGRVRAVSVETTTTPSGEVVLLSGPPVGSRIVLKPSAGLVDGQKVEVQE